MKRLAHGAILSDGAQPVPDDLDPANAGENTVDCPEPSRFDYLFPCLQDPAFLLAEKPTTAQALIALGNAMTDPQPKEVTALADPALDSPIPSVYSYFGQFITHEIVFDPTAKDRTLGPDTVPLDKSEIPKLTNARTTLLDLDSIYGPMLDEKGKCYPVPLNGAEMAVGSTPGGQLENDLPREKAPAFTALIGDGRNDANLITSQMHLAFLKAHNRLVKLGNSFENAQRTLRQHFQWLIVSDYLPRVVDSGVLTSVKEGEIDALKRLDDLPFMPVEFSAAAFRFGHSMPRHRYNYNGSYDKVRLSDLFLPRKGPYAPVIREWIIDWNRFIPGGQNVARRIDTRLVQPLFHLIDSGGQPVKLSLAALDLLRGYQLRLPTGQAVATALGAPVMEAGEIESVAGQVNQEQTAILKESGLSSRTPLWFYILAEAAHFKEGLCLGQVGSTIVAGVLIALVRRSADSILRESNWTPTLGNGQFDLAQLFKLAGVSLLKLKNQRRQRQWRLVTRFRQWQKRSRMIAPVPPKLRRHFTD